MDVASRDLAHLGLVELDYDIEVRFIAVCAVRVLCVE
jgi:hypothetical protein